MSAAIEAGIEGIPAIGFSLLIMLDVDFTSSTLVGKSQNRPYKTKSHTVQFSMSIFPNEKKAKSKGLKFIVKPMPIGLKSSINVKTYGERILDDYAFINNDKGEDTDIWALENG